MQRIPEPELMNDPAQAQAYAHADFAQPHERFVELFKESFPGLEFAGHALDLGCGAADITMRFARAFPRCRIDGLDGAPHMLNQGEPLIDQLGLRYRVRLVPGVLPDAQLPVERYDAIISNSLLHHLSDPTVLWNTIKRRAKPNAPVFIMDLARPQSETDALALTDRYTVGEPDILRRDFFNSLRAAYRPQEVEQQLKEAGLDSLRVKTVSDRHWISSGILS